MSDYHNNIDIRILEREYQFSTPPDEEEKLISAAKFLNQRMKEIRDGGRVVGTERIAVMAALNLAHELLHGENAPAASTNNNSRLSTIIHKIEDVLASDSQMELT